MTQTQTAAKPPTPQPAKRVGPTPIVIRAVEISLWNAVELVLTFWMATAVIGLIFGLAIVAVAAVFWLAFMLLF